MVPNYLGDSTIPSSCYVGPNVIIEQDVYVGENVRFLGNNYIYAGSHISDDCVIMPGAVIGGDPYNYKKMENGFLLTDFEQGGGVMLGRGVTVGCNTCIDRSKRGGYHTMIGDGTHIDNLVHIGHDAIIGRHCLIIAGVVVCGFAFIDNYCKVSPHATIRNRIKVGKGAKVGLAANVVKDVEPGATVMGNPARARLKPTIVKHEAPLT
jgi:UDP-3-O-[3-hydroxymyristoyl] glucosamine N-acyltransferase